MNIVIKARGLTKEAKTAAGTLHILKGIDLEIKQGESVAIVGSSGSGKTTLLGLLAGLDLPSSGQIWLEAQEISELSEDERAALRAQLVGFVFQTFQLLPGLSALENVMLPIELAGHAEAKQQAEHWLERVGLADRARHYPRQLSGGEQQRVALARAFACQPKILFADEPTGNLDANTGAHISDLLFALNSELNTTLVLVTHDETLAQRCQRCMQMQAGELSEMSATPSPAVANS